jgi:Domain of unknown function (DUF4149)
MLALRYASMVALAVWIGSLLALGAIAAPSVFDVIALRDVADGRVLSGAIVGEVFRRFHLVTYGCGVVILASLAARAVLGPRPRRFAVRMGIAVVMLGASLYSGLVVTRAIERLQREIGAAPSSLPEHDPRRSAFGRLHAQSSTIQLVPLVGGLLLMFWELKD